MEVIVGERSGIEKDGLEVVRLLERFSPSR